MTKLLSLVFLATIGQTLLLSTPVTVNFADPLWAPAQGQASYTVAGSGVTISAPNYPPQVLTWENDPTNGYANDSGVGIAFETRNLGPCCSNPEISGNGLLRGAFNGPVYLQGVTLARMFNQDFPNGIPYLEGGWLEIFLQDGSSNILTFFANPTNFNVPFNPGFVHVDVGQANVIHFDVHANPDIQVGGVFTTTSSLMLYATTFDETGTPEPMTLSITGAGIALIAIGLRRKPRTK